EIEQNQSRLPRKCCNERLHRDPIGSKDFRPMRFPFIQHFLRKSQSRIFLTRVCRREIKKKRRPHDRHLDRPKRIIAANQSRNLKSVDLVDIALSENLVSSQFAAVDGLIVEKLDGVIVGSFEDSAVFSIAEAVN